MSANTTNIAGNTVSLVGKQGTIGGESVVMYAKTFHGSLKGVAEDAQQAGIAASLGPTSIGTFNNSSTVEPTIAIMNDYLLNSSLGIRKVTIDADKIINNAINVEADFGDITTRRLDSAEARSKLRDNNNYNNSKFIGALRNDGILSANASLGLPTEIGRIVTKKQKSFGENPIGQTSNPLIKPFKEL